MRCSLIARTVERGLESAQGMDLSPWSHYVVLFRVGTGVVTG